MIRKHLKTLILTSLVTLLPILLGVLLWDRLPAQMPTHWNIAGEVDGWSSRPMAVFGMPLFLLAIQWVCVLATVADPKRENHSDKILHMVLWLIPVISLACQGASYAAALGAAVQIDRIMCLLLGVVFILVGNYLPKCKQNYTIGIKIAWTLHSEENWNRTHRFAGWLWVVCGFVMMLSAFVGGFWLFLPVVLVMVAAPFLYSYLLHRKGI